jgi:hypothetical protein
MTLKYQWRLDILVLSCFLGSGNLYLQRGSNQVFYHKHFVNLFISYIL